MLLEIVLVIGIARRNKDILTAKEINPTKYIVHTVILCILSGVLSVAIASKVFQSTSYLLLSLFGIMGIIFAGRMTLKWMHHLITIEESKEHLESEKYSSEHHSN